MRLSLRFRAVLAAILVWASIPGAESSDSWNTLPTGDYAVGFQLIEADDLSRSIRPLGSSTRAHPRPIRAYVWYPSATTQPSMTFGDYADMATADVWPEEAFPGARERMAFANRPLVRSLASERWEALRAEPMHATRNARPASSTFPLVVIGQGLYYESPITHVALAEMLASHGFVVASCPLAGTRSPLVNLDLVDLETQVRDLEFVIARVRELPFASADRLGVIGFDMGGMAGLILSMRNPDVDAFVSLDAGILYGYPRSIPSGIPASSPDYDPALLRAPWLHATQRGFANEPSGYDGPCLFETATASERYLLPVDSVGHADFTSYALIPDRQPMVGYWGPPQERAGERYQAVIAHVRHFLTAYLGGDDESRRLLRGGGDRIAPGSGLRLEHRQAESPSPTQADVLNALLTGSTEQALTLARAVLGRDSDSPLSDEAILNRLGYHLVSSWQMVAEAVAVFELNAELHPRSVNVHDSLGEAYMQHGNTEAARACFTRVLELQPGNPRATSMLEQLQ